MIKKIFHIYQEQLFNINYVGRKKVKSKYNLSYEVINLENYKQVNTLRGPQYVNDFRKMLLNGDTGVYAKVNEEYVGYGWAKMQGSKDYFFDISSNDISYLCRFYVKNTFRGGNIYPNLINWLIDFVSFNNKTNEFYIAVEVGNEASVKGINKVGFQYLENLKFIRVLKKTFNKHKL